MFYAICDEIGHSQTSEVTSVRTSEIHASLHEPKDLKHFKYTMSALNRDVQGCRKKARSGLKRIYFPAVLTGGLCSTTLYLYDTFSRTYALAH